MSKLTEQAVRRVEQEFAVDDYQPVVVEIDRTIGYKDYQEAQRRLRRNGWSGDGPAFR
jgi:biopolymer transport protein ExbD